MRWKVPDVSSPKDNIGIACTGLTYKKETTVPVDVKYPESECGNNILPNRQQNGQIPDVLSGTKDDGIFNGHVHSAGSDVTGDAQISRTPCLTLQEVTYTVTQRQGAWWRGCCLRKRVSKDVLCDVTARFTGGNLVGILGNSGSGKTSLLDIISCRSDGEVKGAVRLNGAPITTDVFRGSCGYMLQDDRLLASLTVREILEYTAQLKFLGHLDKHGVSAKVDKVIQDMALRHVTNSKIGGPTQRGISGGEKRRVSIAVQLLQDPELLLLDEPTTGLDSFTAHSLVASLAELAHAHNKLVIMTVHQPRSDTFKLFDTVFLLCEGSMMYMGPRCQLVRHFTDIGFPCPTYANPLDHYVDLISVDHRSQEVEDSTRARSKSLLQKYQECETFTSMLEDVRKVSSEHTDSDMLTDPNTLSAEQKSRKTKLQKHLNQIWILFKRLYVCIARDRSSLVVRMVSLVVFAVYVWLFVWQIGFDLTSVQDRTGVFFESMSAACLIGMLNAVALFPTIRDVYHREAGDGLYESYHMLTAYFLHIIPFHLISSLIFSLWLYWGIGLHPDWGRFGLFFTVILILQYLGETQTVIFLGIFDAPALAQSVNTLIVSAATFYATGLIRTFDTMILPLQWLAYLSFFKYGTEVVVAAEYHQLQMHCPEDSGIPCDLYTGDVYLNALFPDAVSNISFNLGILGVFIVAYWLMALTAFKVKGHRILR